MTAVSVSALTSPSAAPAQRPRLTSVWRAAVLGSVVLVAVLVGQLAVQQGQSRLEPELVMLMRGMAVIKGGLALLALALVVWRLGRPVAVRAALAYTACLWLMFASSVLVWFQVSVPGAALLFHSGELALFLVAWREGFPVSSFGRQRRGRSLERTSRMPLPDRPAAAHVEQ